MNAFVEFLKDMSAGMIASVVIILAGYLFLVGAGACVWLAASLWEIIR